VKKLIALVLLAAMLAVTGIGCSGGATTKPATATTPGGAAGSTGPKTPP